jgi:hypothetical protein
VTQAFEEHRFPTREIPREIDEKCCAKCGAGDNCHEVTWAPGLLTRKCKICGTAKYLYVNRKGRGLDGEDAIVLTREPMGRQPRRMTLRFCVNCREEYLGCATKYCPHCQPRKARAKRKNVSAECGVRAGNG